VEQFVPQVGRLCDHTARRDAVHSPLTPVIAAEELECGQDVRLEADGFAVAAPPGQGVGIVDPWLRHVSGVSRVPAGAGFYLWLPPGTVTSLRHVWSHPAFQPKPPGSGEKEVGGEQVLV
jgi:hypothetical protein